MKKRKDGRYSANITLKNGQRKYFYGNTPREVLQKQDEFLKGKTEGMTVEKLADIWNEKWTELAFGTVSEYKAAYKRIVAYFGSESVERVRPSEAEAFLSQLVRQGLSKQTVNVHLIALRQMFKIACKERYIDVSPLEYVSLPRHLPQTKRELPSDEDIEKIKTNLDKPFGLFAYFILYTGMRRGEALAISAKDIDFERKVITVNKKIAHKPNQPVLENFTKTKAGMRKVALLAPLEEALKGKRGILFKGDKDYMSETSFRHAWAQYVKATGIDCTPHQIRHAYATILYEAGISDKDAQEMMGHSSITTTRNIYQSIRDVRLDETRKKLDEFISNDVKTAVK